MRERYLLTGILLSLTLLLSTASLSYSATPSPKTLLPSLGSGVVTLEDFDDTLTLLDLGFNDFAGNMGAINDEYLPQSTLFCATPTACALRLDWDFAAGGEIFTGYFVSLFGLTDTLTTFDGTITETLSFPEHALDLDDIDGLLVDPAGSRQFTELCLELTYDEVDDVQVRLELKDTVGGGRFTRMTLVGKPTPQIVCWDFRTDFTVLPDSPDLDLQLAKLFSVIIEQLSDDGVNNPLTGRLDIHHIWFNIAQPDTEPLDDQELLDLMEKRAYQYFIDWSSRKPRSLDIPQDRSTSGDLLTVGGVGFAVPAHIIGAERGWSTRADSAERVLNILRTLDDPDAFGPESVGRLGHRGWFYHFLGVDGLRKLNFDFPETTIDESLTTVELSSIDTGLAVMGILTAQSYFDAPVDPVEMEIRTRAQAIYDRVEWDFLLEPDLEQFYLGWKPDEMYEGDPFEIPDADGDGRYSGVLGDPDTLDYYTDEALILLLLGIGSDTYPIPPQAYQQLIIDRDEAGLIRTFPGALFTYQFYHAFVPPDCDPVWYTNSQLATRTVIDYATENPFGFATYGATAWGISANEGPFDEYGANGSSFVSVNVDPEEDGSVTYYAMLSAVGFGSELRQEAIAALRAGWERGHWHARFGLPDAFHADVSELQIPAGALRTTGPWQQSALFAIDQGPMLLHLENAHSGLIWQLLDENPNIQRAFDRIGLPSPTRIVLQGEDGMGDGLTRSRSNAWGGRTVWLDDGEAQTMTFSPGRGESARVAVRYSNDNFGPSETVTVLLDGLEIGSFLAEDTGNNGNGWNIFEWSVDIPAGAFTTVDDHTLTVSISGGDGFGFELDAVTVDYFGSRQCAYYTPIILND